MVNEIAGQKCQNRNAYTDHVNLTPEEIVIHTILKKLTIPLSLFKFKKKNYKH